MADVLKVSFQGMSIDSSRNIPCYNIYIYEYPPTPDDGRGSASEEHPADGRPCAGFCVAWLQILRSALAKGLAFAAFFAGGFCSILGAFQELF